MNLHVILEEVLVYLNVDGFVMLNEGNELRDSLKSARSLSRFCRGTVAVKALRYNYSMRTDWKVGNRCILKE